MTVRYSPISQAWFVFDDGRLIRVFNTRTDAYEFVAQAERGEA